MYFLVSHFVRVLNINEALKSVVPFSLVLKVKAKAKANVSNLQQVLLNISTPRTTSDMQGTSKLPH